MKLLRFGPAGHEKPGVLDANGVIRDLSGVIDDISGEVLHPGSLARLRDVRPETLPTAPAGARIGPCVGRIGKIICIGLNYSDHAKESNMAIPEEPIIFMKPTSSLCGPFDQVEIPRNSQKTDWEVELGVVIGKTAKYVDEAQAMNHVAGYCVVNDVSERAFQLERGGQWDKGKGHDTFAPIGPWLVTADEIKDPQDLDMWLEVDGHRYQNGNTRTMIFGVATLVAYLSQFMTLQPGDVICTGTPPGVGLGQKPPKYLVAGQTMKLGIAGLGEQQQITVDAVVPR
ncbi:fumarylacetoacetate hydrolase family protein [Amantichitinum ursilacus]|uniref:Ureidoglycolate lyase n=1 Tax=Amantichitinum ursilacus TaxID=857265 RepID=A0A0N0XKE5_9NEIS|nr:fumarylacetoacetate hydrolase family protein [Amantichitinum ursilacus]KPC53197.1 Ureidoglycolate lyase [Amantichitinum ursilacus]